MLYETILGESFKQLHPKLQERYTAIFEQPIIFRGVMEKADIHPLITPVAKLFEQRAFLLGQSGSNIPFEIAIHAVPVSEHIYDVHWERTFHYPTENKYFHTTMRFDLAQKTVMDTLGNPGIVQAPLQLTVTKHGSLMMHSIETQYLNFLPFSIPIPKHLAAKAYVEEGYDNKRGMHTIHLSTSNAVIGNLMKYVGYFSIETI